MDKYETGGVYHHLRGVIDEAQWAKAVWSSKEFPRQSFHAWLVVLNCLPTRDRLLNWGLQVNHLCLLCNTAPESREHLFMDCPYSYDLWTLAATKCHLHQLLRDWTALLNQMITLPPPRSKKLLSLLVWKSAMHWIWHERNQRLHANSFRSADSLF